VNGPRPEYPVKQPNNHRLFFFVMHHAAPTTPAIATQASVQRLPRWTVLLMCLAYVLPGFVGRAPWKNADVAAFGVMSALAQGHTNWWHPTVMGQPLDTPALLPYWLGALAIKLMPLGAEFASRLPFVVALLLALFLTWRAIFRFALLPSAQPVTFAFGGEARPIEYARSLADGGLLALLACLGLAQLAHETTPAVMQLLAISALLNAIAHFSTPNKRLKRQTAVLWILGLSTLGLSGGPYLAAGMAFLPWVVQTVCSPISSPPSPLPRILRVTWGLGIGVTLAVAGLFGSLLSHQNPADFNLDLEDPFLSAKLLFWFAWPVWPLALWTLWRWRRHLTTPHLWGPLCLTALVVVAGAASDTSDRVFLLGLPSMACIAAFALPTLKRSVGALIDWFSVVFFSLCALTVWVVWVAMLTGYPAKPAANVARLAPGFALEFSGWALAVACSGTATWVWIVRWRLGRHPSALWKSLVLAAAGSTLCWMLLMSLWMPLLDFARSYGAISRRIAGLIPPHTCTEVFGLSQAQIAGLAHHGKLELQRAPSQSGCASMVVSPQAVNQMSTEVDLTQWAFKARLSRLTDNKESLLLYQRVAPPPSLNSN
jgi:4-amino-4-deoxy-L-arabinose transferase-like glycosyltransferase